MLTDGIRGTVDTRHVGRDRAIIDNPTSFGILYFHLSKCTTGTQKSAVYIGLQHRLPFGNLKFVNIHRTRTDPSIVEQKINPTEALDGGIEKTIHFFNVADIRLMTKDCFGVCTRF